MQLVSRKDALAQGLKRYYTGKACYRGHVAEREVSNRGCLQCHADDMYIRQVSNPAHARKLDAESRARRPEDSLRHRKENHSPEDWQKSLDYFKVKNHERRDLCVGTLSLDIRVKLFESQNGCCVGCSCAIDDSAHLDHIVPISRGGINTDDNVQLLCPTCNLSKGAKTMEEWRERIQANVSR